MLIKTTNKCSMGCSHCMEDSTVAGQHMTWSTFERTLEAVARMERLVTLAGLPVFVLFSGGECTEHPDIVKMVETAIDKGFFVTLVSNGMWLNDPDLSAALLRKEWVPPMFNVQVTNDARFYPTKPPTVDDPRITYIDSIWGLTPLGRAARKKNLDTKGLHERKAPGSFNFRSLVHTLRSVEQAIFQLRMLTFQGKPGWCSPNIDEQGTVHAGESRNCYPIGTIESTDKEMVDAVLSMGSCNRCGLEDHLSLAHKRAIGLSTLFAGTER
jgi:MoaA/NifB/PqqE/SkfB family radical SAM enzyme